MLKQELTKLCYKLRVTSKRGKLGFFWQATMAAKKRVFHLYLDGLTFFVDEKKLLPSLGLKPMNRSILASCPHQFSHSDIHIKLETKTDQTLLQIVSDV